ncbi:MAG: porin family protein [Flavobacteriales bacterium]
MIRIIAVIGILIWSLQTNAQKQFQGGLIAGPLFSQISGDGLGGWDKLGFAAGAWVNVPISERNGVLLSMKYVTKGSRTKRDTLDFNSFAYHLNYIDVPILFNHSFTIKKSTWRWLAGPYAGVLISQKVKANGVNYSVPEASSGPDFKRYDIGLMGAVAWWPTSKFFVELSTSTSIIPTRPAPLVVNPGSYYEQGNYNQTLQLMFGLRFGASE